jgi:hypothetical protein
MNEMYHLQLNNHGDCQVHHFCNFIGYIGPDEMEWMKSWLVQANHLLGGSLCMLSSFECVSPCIEYDPYNRSHVL